MDDQNLLDDQKVCVHVYQVNTIAFTSINIAAQSYLMIFKSVSTLYLYIWSVNHNLVKLKDWICNYSFLFYQSLNRPKRKAMTINIFCFRTEAARLTWTKTTHFLLIFLMHWVKGKKLNLLSIQRFVYLYIRF